MSNEEIYEKAFFSTEVPPQNTFERRVALTAMEAARKDEAERFAEWVMKNYYETDDDGMWYKWLMRSKSEDPTYTTSELYQIFKTQTK